MYIEISEGISINSENIVAIVRDSDLTCVVHTESNTFSSTFPYNILIQLLEKDEEPKENETQKKQLRILEQMSSFAG